MRVLMWSGPRNLSTAMMYAFAARGDFAVMDEPFYAPWLAATGEDHPMRAEILASHETDPACVAAACAREPLHGHAYQKHMVHHMEPAFDRSFMAGAANVFLLRHPARVLASYDAKRQGVVLSDIGIVAQLAFWEEARAHGPAPVIDSDVIRQDPANALKGLCEAIDLPWTERMLRWPSGGHPADGVWAAHWYGAVHRSTGFAGADGPMPDLPPHLIRLVEAALPAYEALKAECLPLAG